MLKYMMIEQVPIEFNTNLKNKNKNTWHWLTPSPQKKSCHEAGFDSQ